MRGTDWLYNYLLGFYRDDKSATGWNNLVFPERRHAARRCGSSPGRAAGDDRIRQPRQGRGGDDRHQRARQDRAAPGGKWLVRTVVGDPDAPGALTPVQYKEFVADLVNFLDYVGEPAKNKRISLGIVVLLFLGVLFPLVYVLKREFWKDVH